MAAAPLGRSAAGARVAARGGGSLDGACPTRRFPGRDRPAAGLRRVGQRAPAARAERLLMLLRGTEHIGLAELAALQADVFAAPMLAFRDRLVATLAEPPRDCPVFAALASWDGRYDSGSAGALAVELVWAALIERAVTPRLREAFAAVWHSRTLLLAELDALPAERRRDGLLAALAAARPAFARLRDWGGAHRLRLAHPLGALPGIGRRYRFVDWPWPGSGDTVFKSAHGPVSGRHSVGYGSNARYVFDLSDPDSNHLVVLGGQDGALGSAAFLDQAGLFRRGEYMRVPLRPETARAVFPFCTVVEA